MNIFDYIKWRGDIPFNIDPFNEIDNVCLSQIAYVPYEKIIDNKNRYSLKELSDKYFKKYTEEEVLKDKSLIHLSPLVLKELAKTRRFSKIKMHDFVYINDEKVAEQFACMQFDLDDFTTYVAFRGTDDTLLGWKENFRMTYDLIQGYESSKEYIEKRLKPIKKYRFGGHSKGGGLAMYASLVAPYKLQKQIINIYSNDGPSINPNFVKYDLRTIKNKYVKIIPYDDIIGTVYDDNLKHLVVKSTSKGIEQHDMLSWVVDVNKFDNYKEQSTFSKKFKKEVNLFLSKVDDDDKRKFTENLFSIFKKNKIKHVSELFNLRPNVVLDIFNSTLHFDSKTKKIINDMINVFFTAAMPNIDDIKKSADIFVNKVKRKRNKHERYI